MSAIREFLKYGMYGKSSWYIAYCPLYGRCPLKEVPLYTKKHYMLLFAHELHA